jgi:hypothetical protein
MTGEMPDGSDLAKMWPEILDNLLSDGADVLIVDDAAYYGDEASGYQPPIGAKGTFSFESYPDQEHWQGGYPGTGTNNSPEFRSYVLSWFQNN